jgi:hydrogenase expression/formation protein HypD
MRQRKLRNFSTMDREKVLDLGKRINTVSKKEINLMEFCGTHTHEIFRFGLRDILPQNIHLLSGPGCPVCVTAQEDIDYIITLARIFPIGVITFGDILNVPGSEGSLNHLRAEGKDVRVVYSPLDSLKIAKKNPQKQFLFVGVGFETTVPLVAYTLLMARKERINNLLFLSLHKLTPPAMRAILEMGEVKVDGIIGPGHVSTIIGRKGWGSIFNDYKIPFVIAGFEPEDIMLGILKLIEMVEENRPQLLNAYRRSVREEGNPHALEMINRVFSVSGDIWRGLGYIEDSGLKLNETFSEFDVKRVYPIKFKKYENKGCRCGEVLRGVLKPTECPLYGKVCNPQTPMGPCMVSSEGTCAAYYQYGEN